MVYALIFVFLSLITKPQGLAVIPYYFISLFFFYNKKEINFIKFLMISFFIYFLIFPLLIYLLIENNLFPKITHFMSEGYISGTIFYKLEDFLLQFSLPKTQLSELSYYYYLFLKKVVYQLTFIRETYSFSHNVFLILYSIIIYFFIIINFIFLSKKENLFLIMSLLISLISILLHSSLNTADEPNRHQLFNLIPMYILSALSISNILVHLSKISKNYRKLKN